VSLKNGCVLRSCTFQCLDDVENETNQGNDIYLLRLFIEE